MNGSRLGLALLVFAGLGTAAVLGALEATERARPTQGHGDGHLCAECHDEPPSHEEHADLSCDRCHAIGAEALDGLTWSARGFFSAPEHGASEPCTACHDEAPGGPLATEGHAAHADGPCVGCHAAPHDAAAEAGGAAPACASCHEDVALHGPAGTQPCTTCHAFSQPTSNEHGSSAHDTSALAGVHEAARVTPAEVHGGMDCRRCHDPHEDEPRAAECSECHRGHIEEEIAAGPAGHQTCADCHTPHPPRDAPAIDCLRCHTYPSRGHGWETAREGTVTEAMRESTRARITHEGRCGTCHEPHAWEASEARCVSCHDEQAVAIAALPADTHPNCGTCHEAHEPAPDASRCASCHQDVHRAGAGAPERHRDCLSCHDPHAGRPVAIATCTSCHAAAHAGTRAGPDAHRDCLACHDEHAPPLARTAQACTGCHATEASSIAHANAMSGGPGAPSHGSTMPAEHRCATCHLPHAFAGDGRALERCAGCHEDTVGAGAAHRGTCTSCHENHDAPLGAAARCASCHADVHPSVAEHADCSTCHQPHRAAVDALTTCTGCHAEERAALTSWRGAGPHGGACLDCHTRHDEASRATCESCHAREANLTHTGGHDDCVSCHAPHEPRPVGPVGWWSRCGGCHASEATAVAAATGTHGDCSACHETPGRAPSPGAQARCTNCHERPGLAHVSRGHAEEACASCHATHGATPIGPSTCLDCHEDQRDHFPDAPRCQSFHPFGP